MLSYEQYLPLKFSYQIIILRTPMLPLPVALLLITLAVYILLNFGPLSATKPRSPVYLDNNGTTKIFDESLELMDLIYKKYYGNASAIYSFGAMSKQLLESCRKRMAAMLRCEPCEIYFTSGATESNNIAIRGVYNKYKHKGKHVITSSIEHPSVLETVKSLEGADVMFLPVDKYGKINLQQLENSIRQDTVLVTIIMGSNEIGTLQDVKAIASICNKKGVHFHCDMTQVIGKYRVNLSFLGVSSATGSGHKFHGPKATGFMYLKKGTYFESCMSGGHQEKNIRSGTENIPGIVGMCYALYLCYNQIASGADIKIKAIRDWMEREIVENVPGTFVNGSPKDRLYNTLSVIVPVDSLYLVQKLDALGIYANTGSACSQGKGSSVLNAIGIPFEQQKGGLRISLGFLNNRRECVWATRMIIKCCHDMLKEKH